MPLYDFLEALRRRERNRNLNLVDRPNILPRRRMLTVGRLPRRNIRPESQRTSRSASYDPLI